MKRFFSKKVFAFLCMITCILVMTACSNTTTKITDEANLKAGAESCLKTFNKYSIEELKTYKETYTTKGLTGIASILESLAAVKEEYGNYVATKDDWLYKFEEDSATVSVTTVYGDRDVTFSLTVVPNSEGQLTVIYGKLEPVYSPGELMVSAASNMVIGMGIVFLVLLLMVWIISCFKYIPAIQEKLTKGLDARKNKGVGIESVADKTNVVERAVEEVAEEDFMDDLELIAVITAAIAAMENTSADGLVVRSIKRSGNNKWKRS